MSVFRNRLVLVGASSMVLAASMAVPVAQAATCQAWNATSGDAPSADLQEVIDAAGSGDLIRVGGTCSGGFEIDKDLTVASAPGADRAVLDGGGVATVLTITGTKESPITVKLGHLRITHGAAAHGGGILSRHATLLLRSHVVDNRATQGAGVNIHGTLVLVDALVSHNEATFSLSHHEQAYGGGVYAKGTVILRGSTTVAHNVAAGKRPQGHGVGGGIAARTVIMNHYSKVIDNKAAFGGGIFSHRVVMMFHSRIVDNVGHRHGGGVVVLNLKNFGALRMSQASRISGNVATLGGGVYAGFSRVFLTGRASITHNEAQTTGGGVFSEQRCIQKHIPVSVYHQATISKNTPNNIVKLYDSDACG